MFFPNPFPPYRIADFHFFSFSPPFWHLSKLGRWFVHLLRVLDPARLGVVFMAAAKMASAASLVLPWSTHILWDSIKQALPRKSQLSLGLQVASQTEQKEKKTTKIINHNKSLSLSLSLFLSNFGEASPYFSVKPQNLADFDSAPLGFLTALPPGLHVARWPKLVPCSRNSWDLSKAELNSTPKICVPQSKVLILGMVIPPLIGNPYNGMLNSKRHKTKQERRAARLRCRGWTRQKWHGD